MQELARDFPLLIERGGSIEGVSQDQEPSVLEMHANLVSPPGFWETADEPKGVFPDNRLYFRTCTPPFGVDLHFLAVCGMAANRSDNFFSSRLRAMANGEVLFVY